MSEPAAFDLLHDGVRRQVHAMGWTELRAMQADAIRAVLGGGGHVILSAATASGKTEAAFLPILSAIADDPLGSVRVIYVGPLKALINDQFQRVEELCAHLDVPVHRWHGDVTVAAKAKLVKSPGGVLLITPESLESLMVNRSTYLATLFSGLKFVVIDELHAFLDNDRGRHLRSLLYRIAARAAQPVRIVGLSATLGDPLPAQAYLDCDHPQTVQLIVGALAETELQLRLHAYESGQATDDGPAEHTQRLAEDLVAHCQGNSNLIFANSRSDVEQFGDLCQRLATEAQLPDQFLVHHGSLTADFRQDTEAAMKESSTTGRPATTFCSSTLEMGIDIGSVKMVGQIGAPYSAASLTQRVGRSGRRKNSPRVLRGYLECDSLDANSKLFDRLHLPLVRFVATIELMLKKWVEPAEPTGFDLSTLTQQLISLIAETGGVTAADAYGVLCERGVFREVLPAVFGPLLRQLGTVDVVEQAPDGLLILGLVGEDLRKDKRFYAAFMTGDAYAVSHDGQPLGSVDRPPELKQHMILSGRRWEVVDVNDRKRTVFVRPAHGFKRAPFTGAAGVLHPVIVSEMRQVLKSAAPLVYLNRTAGRLLSDARGAAVVAHVCTKKMIAVDEKSTALLPWVGGRTLDTLRAIIKAMNVDTAEEGQIALVVKKTPAECLTLLQKLRQSPPPEPAILKHLSGPPAAKYDEFLNDDLRNETRRKRWLDIGGARAAVDDLLGSASGLT